MVPSVIFVPNHNSCAEIDDDDTVLTHSSSTGTDVQDLHTNRPNDDLDRTQHESQFRESTRKTRTTRWRGSGSDSCQGLPTCPLRIPSPCGKNNSCLVGRRRPLRGSAPKLFKTSSLPPRLPPRRISNDLTVLPLTFTSTTAWLSCPFLLSRNWAYPRSNRTQTWKHWRPGYASHRTALAPLGDEEMRY